MPLQYVEAWRARMGYHRLLSPQSATSSSESKPYPHSGSRRWVCALAWERYPSRLRVSAFPNSPQTRMALRARSRFVHCLISVPGATSSPPPGNCGQHECGILSERPREQCDFLAVSADKDHDAAGRSGLSSCRKSGVGDGVEGGRD